MSGVKRDNMIIAGRLATPGRSTRGMLRCIWRSLLEGAAMYGAAVHGRPDPEYFRSEVAHREVRSGD